MKEHGSMAQFTTILATLLCLFLAAEARAHGTPAQMQNPPAQVSGTAPQVEPAKLSPSDSNGLAAEPTSLPDFGEQDLNTISDAKKVTLKAKSTTPVGIAPLVVSDDFIVQGNGCGAIVGTDGCLISIAFRPIHSGDISGTVMVTGIDGKMLATIALKGKGLTPGDCGLCKKPRPWRDIFFESLRPFVLVSLFFAGIVLVRWNMIAHPTQKLLEAQIAAVESRVEVMPDGGPSGERKKAITSLLESAQAILHKRANPFDWIFWSRGNEMSGWGYVHDAEEQLASLLPPEQVRARLESCQANLRKLNTPVANALADTVQTVLGQWSPTADASTYAIYQALDFLTSQYSLAKRASDAPGSPPLAGDPSSTLPTDVVNSLELKANDLLYAIDQCLAAMPPPPDPRRTALDHFRAALAPQIQLLAGAADQVLAANAATAANDWTAFLKALNDFLGLRAGWSQGLSDALSADKPPVERGRAVLQEALHVVYDSTDTELSIYASWQNKGLWLTGCALLLMVPLAGLFQNGVLFLVGGVGGLLSRLSRELKRAEFPTDYGAAWMTLFLSPVIGALNGWAGVLLISILKDFGIVGNALKVDWCKPCAPLSLGIAVAFGFSERLFDTVIGQLEDRVAAQKAQATSTGPGSLKIITATLKDGKTMQDYGQVKLDASGGTPPYTWSITAGQLPQGLKMDASGAITGVPMTDGTFSVSVQVTDKDSKTATQKLELNVTK